MDAEGRREERVQSVPSHLRGSTGRIWRRHLGWPTQCRLGIPPPPPETTWLQLHERPPGGAAPFVLVSSGDCERWSSPLFRATMSWVICYRYEANDTRREGRAGEDERGREGERRRVWPCQEGEKLRAVLEEKGCRNPGRRCVWLRKGPGSRSQTDVKREIKSLKRRK